MQFDFLNSNGEISEPAQWNAPVHSKLWLYNLHYFDFLMAPPSKSQKEWRDLAMRRWTIENQPTSGNGWEPYPLSLRLVNWIKLHLGGQTLEPDFQCSLAQQARHLYKNVEWHLLGNHLFANAKALVFAGVFFEGVEPQQWLELGLKILREEVSEQIQNDGSHFELSPMYQAIILEDILDLINLSKCFPDKWRMAQAPSLETTAFKMMSFLQAMTHRNGNISFFNDATLGIAKDTTQLLKYARSLDLDVPIALNQSQLFANAGYARLIKNEACVIADVGNIGPAYIPGHAHADTLSMEYSLGKETIIVNCGISTYERNNQRHVERSTSSHSTVEVDGENSSEVWAAFRVARRARIREIKFNETAENVILEAQHDGYQRLKGRNFHRRNWALGKDSLVIHDHVTRPFKSATQRFHLMPQTTLFIAKDCHTGTITTPSGRKIEFSTSAIAATSPSQYHRGFGQSEECTCLEIAFQSDFVETTFTWKGR